MVVKSADGLTTYTETTDYTIDYTEGNITVLSTGTMATATAYQIDYTCTGILANGGDRIQYSADSTSWGVVDDSGDITLTSDGDAAGRKWKNLGDGVNDGDSVNVGQLEKKINKSFGTNLINPNTLLINHYMTSGGVIYTVSGYSVTDFISLQSGSIISNFYAAGATYNAYYDNDKNFISSFQGDTAVWSNGVAYIRFSRIDGIVDKMANIGTTLLNYIPYTITANLISEESIKSNSRTTEKIDTLAVTTEKIDTLAVTTEKTDFFKPNKNMFNPNDPDVTLGYYPVCTSGTLLSNPSYNTTGFMVVKGNTYYTFSYALQFVWYDENKVYISGECAASGHTFISPSNAKYLRSMAAVGNSWDFLQIEEGQIANPYEPFRIVLDGNYLPDINGTLIANDISYPIKTYLLTGVQNDIFADQIIKRWRKDIEDVRFSGTQEYSRCLQRVASIINPNNGDTIIIDLVSRNNFEILKRIISTVVVGTAGSGTGNVYVSIIGDSVTNAAFYDNALLANNYIPGVKMIGLRLNANYVGQYDEGRGGWRLEDYFIIGNNSGNYNPFMQPDGKKYWGSTGFWKNVWNVINGTDGGGFEPTYSCGRYNDYASQFSNTTGLRLSPAIGDVMYDTTNLTYIEYDGTVWNNTLESDYTWNFNYETYLSMWGFTAPTILAVFLGLNDFRGNTDPENIDFTSWNSQMETVKTSYLTAVPAGKLAIMIAPNTGIDDNVGGVYAIKEAAAMWMARKNIISVFDNRESENIYVVETGSLVDNIYGLTVTQNEQYTLPFSGYTGTDRIYVQTNNPHPTPNYPSLGYMLAAFIQSNR